MSGLFFNISALDKTAKAFQSIQNRVKGLSSQFSGLNNVVKRFAPLLLAAFSIAGLKQIAETAGKIQDFATRINISTEALSELKYVGEQTGVAFETLSVGLQRMTRRVAEAALGSGVAKDALQELGLDAQRLNEMKTEEKFQAIAEAMMTIPEQSDRVRLAFKLFDSGGTAFLQTMKNGADGITKMREEARELGATLTQVQADNITGMNDAFGRLSTAVKGVAQDLLALLAPAIATVVDAVTWAIKQFQVFDGGMTKISWGMVALGNKVGLVSDELFELATIEAWERINKDVNKTTEAYEAQLKVIKEIRDGVRVIPKASADAMKEVNDGIIKPIETIEQEANDVAINMRDIFKESLRGIGDGFNGLEGIALNVLSRISQKMLDSSIDKVADMIFGQGGGSFNLGGMMGGIGNWFGGFFAQGGNFSAGKPIVVGENGPEMIVPRTGGTVIPNGAGGTVVNMHISTPDVQSFRRSQSQIAAEVSRLLSVRGGRNL